MGRRRGCEKDCKEEVPHWVRMPANMFQNNLPWGRSAGINCGGTTKARASEIVARREVTPSENMRLMGMKSFDSSDL